MTGRSRGHVRRPTVGPPHTGPDQEAAAARGHLRAAHVDREHVIAVLKTAFAQGRLTKDELEDRAARAFAAKTYADLAALTADIPTLPSDIATLPSDLPILPAVPAGLTGAGLAARGPASTPARTLGRAARRSGICLIVMIALIEGAFLTGNGFFILLAFFALMAVSGFMGYGIIDARQEWRSRGQLPSRPGQGGPRLEDRRPGQSGQSGSDPAPSGPRPDRTRTDLRAHRPGPVRRHFSRRSVPVPVGI